MNRTGNPDFGKIRNRDNSALNAKKANTANAKALAVYEVLDELKDRPTEGEGIRNLLAERHRESLTLRGLCYVLRHLNVPTPSGQGSDKWQPNTARRLRARVLALNGIDILSFWSE
ncbi:hypothetical protein [Halopseudomonas pelagia]|uniref:hypothetical protein n=1 Tax=Halopseudomonas pelagia TaxID=553151 RepID=UPI001179F35E|nr:hypothetical protein [Halopseudomonas pelagia]